MESQESVVVDRGPRRCRGETIPEAEGVVERLLVEDHKSSKAGSF